MKLYVFLSIVFLLLLSACSGSEAINVLETVDSPAALEPVSGEEADALENTATPVSQENALDTPRVKSHFIPAEKTPTQPPPSPTPEPVFEICSPLSPYSLAELREIVSDPYRPPPPGKEERHHGIDLSHYRRGDLLSIEGVTVQAVLHGRVAAVQPDSFPYGNFIIIETPVDFIPDEWRQRLELDETGSVYILYAHLADAPQVQLGESVNACDELGRVGKTGNTVEAHLHLETRRGPLGVSFPAMGFYKADVDEAQKAAYLRWRIGAEFIHFDPMLLLKPLE